MQSFILSITLFKKLDNICIVFQPLSNLTKHIYKILCMIIPFYVMICLLLHIIGIIGRNILTYLSTVFILVYML